MHSTKMGGNIYAYYYYHNLCECKQTSTAASSSLQYGVHVQFVFRGEQFKFNLFLRIYRINKFRLKTET